MRKQLSISGDHTLTPADDGLSIVLTGSAPQTVTGPEVSGIAVASPGFYCRIYNRGAADATFAPQSPQEPSHAIAVGACAALELGPDGHWLRE